MSSHSPPKLFPEQGLSWLASQAGSSDLIPRHRVRVALNVALGLLVLDVYFTAALCAEPTWYPMPYSDLVLISLGVTNLISLRP